MPLTAASIMTRDVVTARPEQSVAQVAKLLCDHGISPVPVCDEQGRLPATMFAGMTVPVSSLTGMARVMGRLFPMSYFLPSASAHSRRGSGSPT